MQHKYRNAHECRLQPANSSVEVCTVTHALLVTCHQVSTSDLAAGASRVKTPARNTASLLSRLPHCCAEKHKGPELEVSAHNVTSKTSSDCFSLHLSKLNLCKSHAQQLVLSHRAQQHLVPDAHAFAKTNDLFIAYVKDVAACFDVRVAMSKRIFVTSIHGVVQTHTLLAANWHS